MLKYLYSKELFREIPNEITLGISITGCKIRCKDCHSKELWENIGKPLTVLELKKLLEEHQGITCLLLLGGEHDIPALEELFSYVWGNLETAWYSGLDNYPKDSPIFKYLNYYKEGHYDADKGGLDAKTTNQKLYHVIHYNDRNDFEDITYKLQK